MAAVYFTIGVYPGGEKTVLVSDSFGQFSNFYASYRDVLAGEQSFLYTWSGSLGLNYLALAAYYLGGLFTPLVVLFPKEQVAVAMYFITLIKSVQQESRSIFCQPDLSNLSIKSVGIVGVLFADVLYHRAF